MILLAKRLRSLAVNIIFFKKKTQVDKYVDIGTYQKTKCQINNCNICRYK